MASLNIIHTCNSLAVSAGGPPRSITQLCNPLAQRGNDVSIRLFKREDEEVLPNDLVSILPVGLDARDGLKQVVSESLDNTLLHQHGIWLPSAHEVTSYAKSAGIPLVISPRGMMEPWAMNHRRLKKRVAWWLYQRRDCNHATAYHATSQLEAESIRRLGLSQPIIVLPNGVLPASDQPLGEDECVRPKTRKTALFLSRINPKKGLPLLLKAWAAIMPPDWELVIAGNDDENHLPELEALVGKLELQDCVSFAGPLFGEAKDAAYRSADIFVLPTYSENFGIVVAEALSYGVPVITTTGTPWEELREQHCGWFVSPRIEGIQSALEDAFSKSEDEITEMGLRGRQLVKESYSWDTIAESMERAYLWILGKAPIPKCVLER